MKVRVANEFERSLPEEAVRAIETFNGWLDENAEEVRRTLARKVFAKNGENPKLDSAIESLLNAKQAVRNFSETQAEEQPLTIGFDPAEFTWGEIWRESNYADMRLCQSLLEKDIKVLHEIPAQNDDISRARQQSIEDRTGELAHIKALRRITALGTAAFMNTPRYDGPGAPLNFIDPSDFVDRTVEAA